MASEKALKAFLGVWSGTGTYLTGHWVKGSDSKFYKAISDGGQAENPVIDTNNTYWEHVGASQINETAQGSLYETVNEIAEKLNLLIDYVNQNTK